MAGPAVRDAGQMSRLVVLDATAPGAAGVYLEERSCGATLAVYGAAPWADGADIVDEGIAAFLALYADRVEGGGLPAAVRL